MSGSSINIGGHSCGVFDRVGDQVRFLGSGFFFKHVDNIFGATAEHVIRASAGRIEFVSNSKPFPMEIARVSKDSDLCLLVPSEAPDGVHMTLSSDNAPANNLQLYNYEFSTTYVSEKAFVLNPATRIGNCVRLVQFSHKGKMGEDMLELSFPAIKGASGSPVVELRHGQMIAHGIVVANSEHHLLPAHIETVLDEKNDVLEERKYFLPYAVAVNSRHLINLINDYVATQPGENPT